MIQPDPPTPLNCHETADKYLGAGNLYLYSTKANSIVNTTGKHIKFYNYPRYNDGHPEGDSFCVRALGNGWFDGYHEPNRPR